MVTHVTFVSHYDIEFQAWKEQRGTESQPSRRELELSCTCLQSANISTVFLFLCAVIIHGIVTCKNVSACGRYRVFGIKSFVYSEMFKN
jgi:hypothetical protein